MEEPIFAPEPNDQKVFYPDSISKLYQIDDMALMQLTALTGLVKKGSETEGKEYCAEGIYLTDGSGVIMLTSKQSADDLNVFVGKNVELLGRYPTSEVRCEALICGCEDYVLVEKILEK